MAGEVEAGKAAVEIVLNDEPLKRKLEEAEKSISDLGKDGPDIGANMGQGLGNLGKAIDLLDRNLGGAFGKVGKSLGGLSSLVGSLEGNFQGLSKVLATIAPLAGKAALAYGAFKVGSGIGEQLGEWMGLRKEINLADYAAEHFATTYASALNSMADKQDAQIERLKKLAQAEHLSNEERETAIKLIQRLNAQGVALNGDHLEASANAWKELAKGTNDTRVTAQQAVVDELRRNIERLRKGINETAENGGTTGAFLQKSAIAPLYLAGQVLGTDWYKKEYEDDTTYNPELREKLKELEKQLNEETDKLAEAERKLSDLRSGEGVDGIRKQMAAEQEAIAKRQAVANALKKIEQEAADVTKTAREKQLSAIRRREEETLRQLTKNNASEEELARARAAFNTLFFEIEKAADKANQEAAKARQREYDKIGAGFDKQSGINRENVSLDLAKVEGEDAYARQLNSLIEKWAGNKTGAMQALDELTRQMEKVDVGSEGYKELEDKYKREFERFSEAAKRWNDLVEQQAKLGEENVRRAAEYSKSDYFGKMDAERGFKREQRGIDELAQNLQSSGDVAGMQELADAARMAANAARQYAEDQLVLALLDEQLTEEEKDLIDALREHAKSQDDLAESYEQAVSDLQKASKGFGGGAGGYDPSTVVAKALAQAARNDKSLGYQQKTAEGVQKLVELEKNRRDAVVTFQ